MDRASTVRDCSNRGPWLLCRGRAPLAPKGLRKRLPWPPQPSSSPGATRLCPPSPAPAARAPATAIFLILWSLFGPAHAVSSSAFAILELGGPDLWGARSSISLQTG